PCGCCGRRTRCRTELRRPRGISARPGGSPADQKCASRSRARPPSSWRICRRRAGSNRCPRSRSLRDRRPTSASSACGSAWGPSASAGASSPAPACRSGLSRGRRLPTGPCASYSGRPRPYLPSRTGNPWGDPELEWSFRLHLFAGPRRESPGRALQRLQPEERALDARRTDRYPEIREHVIAIDSLHLVERLAFYFFRKNGGGRLRNGAALTREMHVVDVAVIDLELHRHLVAAERVRVVVGVCRAL